MRGGRKTTYSEKTKPRGLFKWIKYSTCKSTPPPTNEHIANTHVYIELEC